MGKCDKDGKWLTIVIGAAVGALVGAGIDFAVQMMENDGDIHKVNGLRVLTAAGAGALSGALAGSGVGLFTTVATSAVIGGLQSVANDAIERKPISVSAALVNAGAGALGGLIGGAGALHGLNQTINMVKNPVYAIVKETLQFTKGAVSRIASQRLIKGVAISTGYSVITQVGSIYYNRMRLD